MSITEDILLDNNLTPSLPSGGDPINHLEGWNKNQKLAGLLVVLGSEVASTILNQFDEREVEEIMKEHPIPGWEKWGRMARPTTVVSTKASCAVYPTWSSWRRRMKTNVGRCSTPASRSMALLLCAIPVVQARA